MADQTYGKATPERGLAFALEGALQGFVQGRGMARQNVQDQRDAESQAAEMKAAQLDQQIKQAQYDEYQAMANLRKLQAEATLKATQAKDPIDLQRAKIEEAKWNSVAAQARAHLEELKLRQSQQVQDLTATLNRIQGFLPPAEGDQSMLDSGGVDTRDMPATDGGGGEAAAPGLVPGGRQVLVGPPQQGNIAQQEQTQATLSPGDFAAKNILPPGVQTTGKSRVIPIQQSEVEDALKAKDANDAIQRLMTNQGSAFGAAAEKKKREDPLAYQNDMSAEIDRHMKQYPGPYKVFREPGGMQSKLKQRMLQIMTDPNERAWQNTRDTDAVAAQGVSELSLEELLSDNPNNPLLPYLSIDRVNGGDVARYNGRLLNLAMRDTFKDKAQNLVFSDDLDYTLRQIVEALYSDQIAATGHAQLGFTNPLSRAGASGLNHPIMDLLDAYWEPVRRMDAKPMRYPGQYQNPLLSRPGRE